MTFTKLAEIKQRIADGYYDDRRFDRKLQTLIAIITGLQEHGYPDDVIMRVLKINTGMSEKRILSLFEQGDRHAKTARRT